MEKDNQPGKENIPSSYYQPPNDVNNASSDSHHSTPRSLDLDISNFYVPQGPESERQSPPEDSHEEGYYCMTCHENFNITICPCRNKKQQKQKFTCDYEDCNRSFQAESTFSRHKMIHAGVKPYECDYQDCDQRFNQKSNLNRHKRIHTQEKPFICEKCCKSFTTTTNLKQHVQVHFEDKERRKKYVCEIKGCNKEYLYMCNLKKHKQEHDDPITDCLVSKKPDFPIFSFNIGNCSFRIGYKRHKEHYQALITTQEVPNGIQYSPQSFQEVLNEVNKERKTEELQQGNCIQELDNLLRRLLEQTNNALNVVFQMHEGLSPIANMLVKALTTILGESNLKVFSLIMPEYSVFMDVVKNLLRDINPRQ